MPKGPAALAAALEPPTGAAADSAPFATAAAPLTGAAAAATAGAPLAAPGAVVLDIARCEV